MLRKRSKLAIVCLTVVLAIGMAGCSGKKEQTEKTKELVTAKEQVLSQKDLGSLLTDGTLSGIYDMDVKVGTKVNLKEFTFVDSKIVKAIDIDDSQVKYDTKGSYLATYSVVFNGPELRAHIKGKNTKINFETKGDLIPIKFSIVIKVTTEEDMKKEAAEGKKTVTKETANKIKTENKNAASSNATSAEKKPETAAPTTKPSSGSSSSGSSSSSSEKPNTSGSASYNENNKPAHTHVWKPVYKTVHHDTVYNTVTKEVPVYETKTVHNWCKECGKQVNAETHQWPTEVGGEGYTSHNLTYHKITTQVGTRTETEQVLVKGAYDEQVIDHYECSCGARK